MNYPMGSSGGSADARPSPNCSDAYSPTDIQWLRKVYKGTGTVTTGTGSGTGTKPIAKTPKVVQKTPVIQPLVVKKAPQQFDIIQTSPMPTDYLNVYIYIALAMLLVYIIAIVLKKVCKPQ